MTPLNTTSLQDTFNTRSRAAEELSRLPAHRFELETGLTGLAGNYRFPGSLRAKDFEDRYFWGNKGTPPAFLKETSLPEKEIDVRALGGIDHAVAHSSPGFRHVMLQLWDKMVRLNPPLAAVAVDRANPNHVYDALHGAASGFNPDDINFYLRTRWIEGKMPALLIASGTRAVENLCGVMPEWITSPQTLDKIGEQLGRGKLSQELDPPPAAPPPLKASP